MQDILINYLNDTSVSSIDVFKKIIAVIRPANVNDVQEAENKIMRLQTLLERDGQLRAAFAKRLTALVGEARQSELFTNVTAVSRSGFFGELRKLAFYKLLPPFYDINQLSDILHMIFSEANDYKWFSEVSNHVLVRFIKAIGVIPSAQLPNEHYIVIELMDDLYLLSQVISTLSMDSHIIKNFNELLTVNSPFHQLHVSIATLVDGVKKNVVERNTYSLAYIEVYKAWKACLQFENKIRESKNEYGTSLHLTVILQKIHKCLVRVNSLMQMLLSHQSDKDYLLLVQFAKRIVKIENQRYSIRNYFNETISLLAFQVTEHTGKTGEHYVTNTVKEYFQMFFNALKGGFVVAFLVLGKILVQFLKLPVFQDTLLKGLNYSLGFVGIHVWHGVLATKQPAMTAATIAQSIESTNTYDEIKELGNFIIKVFRSQFVAVVGNLAMVFPVAFFIAWLYHHFTGNYILGAEEAHHKFELVHPFKSFALLHAGIAGIMLFAAGILSGLADNGNIFNRYSDRLQYSKFIKRIAGKKNAKKLSAYITKNLGAITGNFTLGFLLAFVSFFGFITGLPLDIMHVTFATGTLGFAGFEMMGHLTWIEVMWACLGISGIGLMNIGVSFSLAIFVAVKSRGIDLSLMPDVLKYLLKEFFRNPVTFFYPLTIKK
jgi:site-specific recombinase